MTSDRDVGIDTKNRGFGQIYVACQTSKELNCENTSHFIFS